MIIKIRKFIVNLVILLNKSERNKIRKRLNEIDTEKPNRRQSRRLLEELTKIFIDVQFKKDHINNDCDSSSCYSLKDLECTFGDLDDYYKPIFAKESFDGNYQMYTCRGAKERTMSTKQYLRKIKPYLIVLIDDKKDFKSSDTTRHSSQSCSFIKKR